MVGQEEKVPKIWGDAKTFREWYEQFRPSWLGAPVWKSSASSKALSWMTPSEPSHGSACRKTSSRQRSGLSNRDFGSVFTAQHAHVVDIRENCNGKGYKCSDKWHLVVPAISQNAISFNSSEDSFEGAAVVHPPLISESFASTVRETFLRRQGFSPSENSSCTPASGHMNE